MNRSKYLNRIFQGDTLTVLRTLPDEIVDVGVTSPPYNKGEKDKGWLVDKVIYKDFSDNQPEEIYQQQQIKVLNELYRVTKPGGSFFYDHKIRWKRGIMLHPYSWISKTKWTLRQEIIWNRKIAANIRGWRFWQVEERIYWLIKPEGNNLMGRELKSKHALLTSIWEIFPEKKIKHPAPFPIELPVRCIYSILDEKGGLVIDPYCGSGSTLVAAKLLGCDYIGIEISPEYIKMAEERLITSQQEKIRVQLELEKHKVTKTFKQRKEEGYWVTKPAEIKPDIESQLLLIKEKNKNVYQARQKTHYKCNHK
ncbi:MAG: site-specific DNA-methyltransferase [Elusimicrobiota bacterium]